MALWRRRHLRRSGSASRTALPPAHASVTAASVREKLLVPMALMAMVLIAYSPAFFAGFVWDDVIFSEAEAVLEWSGLARLWFEPSHMTREAHYWPLVYSTFWLEHKLWGLNPAGYHVVNVALHGVNTVLLWRILDRLEVPGAWLAAALFAVHPMQAEAVTWVMGRKDVLSTLFYLTAAGCWLSCRERPRIGIQALMLLLFAAGMLTKSMVVTLPVALLLCVWWKHGRISMTDVGQAAPLFVVGFGIAVIDLIHYSAQTEGFDLGYSWIERLLIASRVLWFYSFKLFWPHPLPVMYELWDSGIGNPLNWLCLSGALAVVGALWLLRKRIGRGPLAGMLFFAITLSPVLGLNDNVFMEISFVADRYQYLASVGVKAVVAGGLTQLLRAGVHFSVERGLGRAGHPRILFAARLAMALPLVVCAGLAMRHATVFRDEVSLFGHVVSINPAGRGAYYSLGRALAVEGREEEGLEAMHRALDVNPDFEKTHGGIGWILLKLQRHEEAEEHLRMAVAINPVDRDALLNLAQSLRFQERFEEALHWYNAIIDLDDSDPRVHIGRAKALGRLERHGEALDGFERALAMELDPEMEVQAHGGIGWILMSLKREQEAEMHLRRAVELKPSDQDAVLNLAASLRAQGRHEEALLRYDDAIDLDGDSSLAHIGKAMVLSELERNVDALDNFERALELDPGNEVVHGNIGWILLTLHRHEEAEEHLHRAVEANPADKEALQNLAESLRFQGRFEEALLRYEAVIELDGNDGLAHAGRAMMLGELGRNREAREGFERALAVKPELEAPLSGLPVFRRAMGLEGP